MPLLPIDTDYTNVGLINIPTIISRTLQVYHDVPDRAVIYVEAGIANLATCNNICYNRILSILHAAVEIGWYYRNIYTADE